MARIPKSRLRVLNFIRAFLRQRGYTPTVRDIVKGCNISTSSVVQYHLNMLEREGYIHRDPKVFRSVRLIETEQPVARQVPLLGTIAAGEPLPVPTSDTWSTVPEEIVKLSDELIRGREGIYALRVKGSSMIDALIDDGDIVLMQQASKVDNGDMAAVWLKKQQEVTLKKVYRDGNRICLQPANRQMEPMYQDLDNVEIQGRVIGIIREISS
ncbi:MAG TPA: repressor LexA [Dehalococcoidia bacterium]|nr:repressor LexA [Dehalococcoidia bacterium]